MIQVTRLNGDERMLNAVLIETIEETPDTTDYADERQKVDVRERRPKSWRRYRSYMQDIGSVRLSVKSERRIGGFS